MKEIKLSKYSKNLFFPIAFIFFLGVIIIGSFLTRKAKANIPAKEILAERTENKKVFLNSDGTYTIRLFQSPIHYESNGVYKDIDNTLILDDSYSNTHDEIYRNKASNILVRIKANIEDENPVTLSYEKYKISIKPIYEGNIEDISYVKLNSAGEAIDEKKIAIILLFML